jgi:hypothetical protein
MVGLSCWSKKMPDVKISALPASTVPLAGTEVLPIVQSATTRQVSVANLTAGRSVSGTNFIPSGSSVPSDGFYLPAGSSLGFSTSSTERARIDSSGSLLIGTAVAPTTGGVSRSIVSVKQLNDTSGFSGIQIEANANTNLLGIGYNGSAFNFAASYRSTGGYVPISFTVGGSESMRIDTLGGLQVLNTIGVGNTAPSTSGAGITFPATQSASSNANTLDDYEEGTWTPTDASGAGLTFTGASGTYVKIGSLCYVTGALTFPVTVSAANANIGGLPFNPNASTVYNNYGPPIRNDKSLSMQIFGVDNTTFILLPIGSYTTYVLNSAMTSGTMLFSFTYRTI